MLSATYKYPVAYVLDERGAAPAWIAIPRDGRFYCRLPIREDRPWMSFVTREVTIPRSVEYIELVGREYVVPALGWRGVIFGEEDRVFSLVEPASAVLEFLLWLGRLENGWRC